MAAQASALPQLDMSTSVPLSQPLPPVDMSTSVPLSPDEAVAARHARSAAGKDINYGTQTTPGVVENLATGVGKGAGQTIQDVASLAPGGKQLVGSGALGDTNTSASGIAQQIGKGGEAVMEFMLGDAALDGLSLGEKLERIAPTIKAIESHPRLAKVVGAAVRGAVVGGTQGAVAGAPQGNAVSGAAKGAALGAAGGALTEGIFGEGAGATKSNLPEASQTSVAETLPPNPFRAAANKVTGANIQPDLQSGIRDTWNQVADSEGVHRPLPGISVRDMGEQVGDSVYARSKATYDLIDKATDGRFSGTEAALRAVNNDLKFVTNDTEEQNLLIRKNRFEMQLAQMFDDAEKKGLAPQEAITSAKRDFKTAQAIYDTNDEIRASTTGVRPGMPGSKTEPEEVNSKSLMNRMNKLYNRGRLQEASGDHAEDFIGHAAKAQTASKQAAKIQGAAKKVGTVGLGALGYEGARHLIP